MKILSIIVVLLVSNVSGETHNETKTDIDEDEVSRIKRAELRLHPGQSKPENIKVRLDLKNIPNLLAIGTPKTAQVQPITNLKKSTKTSNQHKVNKVTQNARHRPIKSAKNIKKTTKPKHVSSLKPIQNDYKDTNSNVGFFIEKDDMSNNIEVKKETPKVITSISNHKSRIEDPITSFKMDYSPIISKGNDEHLKPSLNNESSKTSPINDIKDEKSKESKLTTEIKKVISANKNNDDVYDDVVKILPDLIKSLLGETKQSTTNLSQNMTDTKIIGLLQPETKPSVIPVLLNLNKSDDVSNFLVIPNLGNHYNDSSDMNDLTEVCLRNRMQNETIDTIKITQQNYTEITENKYGSEIKVASENSDSGNDRSDVVKEAFSNHVTETSPNHSHELHEEIYLGSSQPHSNQYSITRPTRPYESPHPISDGTNVHNTVWSNYKPDFPFSKPEYDYSTDKNINVYTYNINGNGVLETSSVVENDGKNTTWKTWTNTEVVIKTAKNDSNNLEIEAKTTSPQQPVYKNNYKSNNYYSNPPSIRSNWQYTMPDQTEQIPYYNYYNSYSQPSYYRNQYPNDIPSCYSPANPNQMYVYPPANNPFYNTLQF